MVASRRSSSRLASAELLPGSNLPEPDEPRRAEARAGPARRCALRAGRSASTSASAQSRSIWRPMKSTPAGGTNSLRVAEHAELQRDAQLCCGRAAGPRCSAARCPAGGRRRRRGQRLPRPRVRRPGRPGRVSTAACAPCGRAMCSSSGNSTASAGTSPTWSTPCRTVGPRRGPAGYSPARARRFDTTTAAGRLVFGIFAALAEFERELIRERTVAGLEAARARGRKGGRKFALTKAQVRLAQAAMAHRDTSVTALCREIDIRPVTLYRHVGPQGELREQGWRRGSRAGGASTTDRVRTIAGGGEILCLAPAPRLRRAPRRKAPAEFTSPASLPKVHRGRRPLLSPESPTPPETEASTTGQQRPDRHRPGPGHEAGPTKRTHSGRGGRWEDPESAGGRDGTERTI